MRPTTTRDATHNFQSPENWDAEADGPCGDLQVRAEAFGERQIVELISTWKPTEHELAHLNRGDVIEIGLCVTTQPPMRVYVVDPPVVIMPERKSITINEHAHGDDSHG